MKRLFLGDHGFDLREDTDGMKFVHFPKKLADYSLMNFMATDEFSLVFHNSQSEDRNLY